MLVVESYDNEKLPISAEDVAADAKPANSNSDVMEIIRAMIPIIAFVKDDVFISLHPRIIRRIPSLPLCLTFTEKVHITGGISLSADKNAEKKAAAQEAAKHVKDGMLIGIGTGTTIAFFIDELRRLVSEGIKFTGVPTSLETEKKARDAGIEITTAPSRSIDITFDGADEADTHGNLIKGAGGALLREKVVAHNSKSMYVLIDSSKMKGSEDFGSSPLPIEIIPYLEERTRARIEEMGVKCAFRKDKDFRTDNGNLILDCMFEHIPDPKVIETKLKLIPGVAEVGLFCKYADLIIEGHSGKCVVHKVKK